MTATRQETVMEGAGCRRDPHQRRCADALTFQVAGFGIIFVDELLALKNACDDVPTTQFSVVNDSRF
jgi:hypothetical protein